MKITRKSKPAKATRAQRHRMTALKQWMQAASSVEQQALADALGTTRDVLYHYSGAFRGMSNTKAQLMEQAVAALRKMNPKLPMVYRTDVNEGCRNCEFAEKCLGSRVVARSEFPFVNDTKPKRKSK